MPKRDFTEKRLLEVQALLKDRLDNGMEPSRDLVQEAADYLAYLHQKAAMSLETIPRLRDTEEDRRAYPLVRLLKRDSVPTPAMERMVAQALDPIAALEEMFGCEVVVVGDDHDDVEGDMRDERRAPSVRAGEEDWLHGHEAAVPASKETFTVHAGDEPKATSSKNTCADAAQEAEHLHAETGMTHSVRGPDAQVWYESKGPPPEGA